MTGDEIIRGLVRHAHDADPEQVEVDVSTGLNDVRRRLHPRETMDRQELTVRQREILDVIRAWVDRFGHPPSVRELGDAVGLRSTSSVAYLLRALQSKGYLRRDPNRPRAIAINLTGDTNTAPDPPQPERHQHNH